MALVTWYIYGALFFSLSLSLCKTVDSLLLVLQLAGIVYVGPSVAKSMVDLHALPPLDACTYFGLDNGAQPLSVSLLCHSLLRY